MEAYDIPDHDDFSDIDLSSDLNNDASVSNDFDTEGALGGVMTVTPKLNGGAWIHDEHGLVADVTQRLDGGAWITTYGANAIDQESVANFGMDEIHDILNPSQDSAVGTPDFDKSFWQEQTTDFTCAVQAQRSIIEQFTGQQISEAQLTYEATAHGWLTDNGMAPSDVGNLLELHGIQCHSVHNASFENLMAELAQGHKVVIGVDSGELWNTDGPLEDLFGQAADHAISPTGVRLNEDGQIMVTVNDSGVSDGAGKEYSLDEFMDAWGDSGFSYVATDNPPPIIQETLDGFDYELGYFPDMVAAIEQEHPGFTDSHIDSDSVLSPNNDIFESPFEDMSDTERNQLFQQI